MPVSFTIKPPHGISASHGFRGESVEIELAGFYSTQDGEAFVTIADQFTKIFQTQLQDLGVRPSQIDNLLVSFDPNGNGFLYCNELDLIIGMRTNQSINKGEGVFDDDILDIEELRFRNRSDGSAIVPSENNAIVFIFSSGWRKGLYFNLSPVHPHAPEPLPDLAKLFGSLFCQVRFQEKFSANENQWKQLIKWRWFPFSCLAKEEMKGLLSWSSQERYPDEFLANICNSYKERLPSRIAIWKKSPHLQDHGTFIDKAYDHYKEEDWISSIQTLSPRIEGVLRIHLAKEHPNLKIKQSSMVSTLVDSKGESSLLLPKKFQEYLLSCYFQNFDLKQGTLPLSRHTVSHGVSRAEDYTFMENTLLFMILDEIISFLPKKTGEAQDDSTRT